MKRRLKRPRQRQRRKSASIRQSLKTLLEEFEAVAETTAAFMRQKAGE
jgi:hypothetical protein